MPKLSLTAVLTISWIITSLCFVAGTYVLEGLGPALISAGGWGFGYTFFYFIGKTV